MLKIHAQETILLKDIQILELIIKTDTAKNNDVHKPEFIEESKEVVLDQPLNTLSDDSHHSSVKHTQSPKSSVSKPSFTSKPHMPKPPLNILSKASNGSNLFQNPPQMDPISQDKPLVKPFEEPEVEKALKKKPEESYIPTLKSSKQREEKMFIPSIGHEENKIDYKFDKKVEENTDSKFSIPSLNKRKPR